MRVLEILMIAMVLAVSPIAMAASSGGVPSPGDVYSRLGLAGGVVVQLGALECDSLAALRISDSYLVQGLSADAVKVQDLRRELADRGLQGQVTVRELDGSRLPYIDNMVNLLVVTGAAPEISRGEMLRVLCPRGAVVRRTADGYETLLQKPWPEDIDEWTHYLHDSSNNAVSNDTRIDSISRQQWVGGPRWSRHHDHIASLTAMVSAGGRIFYVMDEGKTTSILLPSRHFLVARDAFNGVVLWKKPLASWHPHLWPLKSGPAQLPRRLVAVDDRIYVPLGMAEPLSVLDAATGEVLQTFADTKATEEVLVGRGLICALTDPTPELFEDFTLGNAHNGAQKSRVARDYPWNKKPKTLVVLDEASGQVRWQKQIVAAPLSLAMSPRGIFFYNGSRIVSLDPAAGEVNWQSEPISAKRLFATNESPILVCHKDYVLFAGANGLMSAYSAETGRRLWESEHLRGGYCSPQDLFVIDDLVWSGAIASPRSNGLFVGKEIETGEAARDIPAMDVPYTFGHHRCFRAKATSRFILASKTGIEFYDIEKRQESVNHWVRGGCLYGIMPANGLTYAPMHSCACHLDSKLTGFNALAPAASAETQPSAGGSPRLVKGPAYARTASSGTGPSENGAGNWTTYRGDAARSGGSDSAFAGQLNIRWQAPLNGKLSALTVDGEHVYVAAVDAHRLYALDKSTGEIAWAFDAGGRIDSPPTVFRGFVYFGCADGHIYSLSAVDGGLAWRFRLAPTEQQLCSYGHLESVWPVNGSVLIKDGMLFSVGGRSSFLDGGLPFVRLDALSGEVQAEAMLDDFDVASGKSMQLLSDKSIMPSAIPDILSCDDGEIFMRVQHLSEDGQRLGTFEFDEEHQYEERHLFSWAGFLEDSWLHRIYMIYGNGKIPLGTYLNWWTYGERNPDGRILVMDDERIFGYGLKPKYHTWSSTFLDYQLFSVNKKIETDPISGPTIFGKPTGRTPVRQLRYNWTAELPFYVRAMIRAGDQLVVCGPEKIIDEKAAVSRYPDRELAAELELQDAIWDGSRGSELWLVGADDGKVRGKQHLDSLPVWDGMAAAGDCVYLATQTGVVCVGRADGE